MAPLRQRVRLRLHPRRAVRAGRARGDRLQQLLLHGGRPVGVHRGRLRVHRGRDPRRRLQHLHVRGRHLRVHHRALRGLRGACADDCTPPPGDRVRLAEFRLPETCREVDDPAESGRFLVTMRTLADTSDYLACELDSFRDFDWETNALLRVAFIDNPDARIDAAYVDELTSMIHLVAPAYCGGPRPESTTLYFAIPRDARTEYRLRTCTYGTCDEVFPTRRPFACRCVRTGSVARAPPYIASSAHVGSSPQAVRQPERAAPRAHAAPPRGAPSDASQAGRPAELRAARGAAPSASRARRTPSRTRPAHASPRPARRCRRRASSTC